MKTVILFFVCFFSINTLAEDQPMRLSDMSWIAGGWQGEFNHNNLQLHFTGAEGGVVLGTYKQLSPNGEIKFMRFSSLMEKDDVIQLHLYPFLNASPDVFIAKEFDGNKIVFERVYKNQGCKVDDMMDALGDPKPLQEICDRFPIQITYEQTNAFTFQETFFGFLPSNGKQRETQFTRDFTR
jgi:hypothetical protein